MKPAAQTKATTWKELREHQLRNRPTLAERIVSKPLKQLGFQRSIALFGYIADFYNPTVKLVVEIDGPYHSEREELDRNRDVHLAARGIQTLRFTNEFVFNNLGDVLMKTKACMIALSLRARVSRRKTKLAEPSMSGKRTKESQQP